MIAHDPYEQALRDVHAALAELRQRKMPPSPLTLLVWYCHASGRYPNLSREMAELKPGENELDDRQVGRLSRHLFGVTADVIGDISRRLEESLAATAERISVAAARERHYGDDLRSFRDALSADQGVQVVQDLIVGLLEKTTTMQHQTKQLQRQLLDSSTTVVELREELEVARREANFDSLTGIANRRAFDSELMRLAAEAELTGSDLSVLLIDVDRFKTFNDRFGHPMGDQLLRLIAKTIRAAACERDVVARYGGEEFAVLMPSTPLKKALKLAVHIRKSVAASRLTLRHTRKDLGQVTVSVGVAELQHGEPPAYTVARADQALYRAKAAGRNRAVATASDGRAETVLGDERIPAA